jgi:chorismate mutase
VHGLIVAQYRTLNVWHNTHDARLKDLKKIATGADAEKSAAAKAEIETIHLSLKTIHDNYITAMANELSAELIERVKDGMTVGKVKFTYTGYVQQIPALTEEQKAKVLELLKEAREEAMDAGSMDEKSDIFNRYKGRINNWLSKQGVDQGKGKMPKAEKKEPAGN